MQKRRLGTLLLVACLILTAIPAALGAQSTKVVTVAGDGSGDYNCDGKADDVQINQALEFAAQNPGTTVHLKGPFTYDISDSLRIGSIPFLKEIPVQRLSLPKDYQSGVGVKAVFQKRKPCLWLEAVLQAVLQ